MQVQARTHQVFMGLRHSHDHRGRACAAFPVPEPGYSPCFRATPANRTIFNLARDPALDPTGKGRKCWTIRWKDPLNAFQIHFEGRLTPATH